MSKITKVKNQIRIVGGPSLDEANSNKKKMGKKPTFRERLRARRVRKQNEKSRKAKERQIEDFRSGRADTKEVHFDNRTIWNKMLSDKTYGQFKEMGDSEEAISEFQKRRMVVSLVFLVLGGVIGYFLHPVAVGIGFVLAIITYVMKGRSVDAFYKNWKFERQLAFSKFTRLVIPYLKASDGNMALYTIFNRILKRMEDPEDRKNLYQLMVEMGDDPANIQPFVDFADRSSGTDMSHLFMTTIFDFQQSTFDVSVIDELGKLASEDMMRSVDEIIEFKLQRFGMFPTKIVMSSFLLVAGLAVGFMIHSMAGLNFGGFGLDIDDSIDPNMGTEEVQPENRTSDDAVWMIDGEEFV